MFTLVMVTAQADRYDGTPGHPAGRCCARPRMSGLIIIVSHRQLARCWWCWDNLNILLAFPGRKVGDVAAPAGREARPPQGDRPDEDGNEGQVPGPAPRPGPRRRSSVTCTVGDALDDWLAAGLSGRSDRTGGALQDTVKTSGSDSMRSNSGSSRITRISELVNRVDVS
jgi:hypothetical protein